MFRMFRKKATVFTLLFTMSLSQMAYASSTDEAISQKDAQTIDCNSCNLTINDEKKVLQDEELFREMSVDLDMITLEKASGTSPFVYKIDYGDGSVETTEIRKASNGDIVMDVYDGNLHDTITKTADGKLLLDGKEVVVESNTEVIEGESFNEDVSVASQYGRGSVYRTTPYKGKAADYTKKVKTIKKASVKADKLIRNMTITAIATVLEKSIQICVPLTLSVKVLSEAAKKVKPAAERNAPNSKCLSYKLVKYAYKSNSKTDKYYKYTGAYYPKKNYEGGKIAHTFYEYNAIGL
jgi:hypothetical protein